MEFEIVVGARGDPHVDVRPSDCLCIFVTGIIVKIVGFDERPGILGNNGRQHLLGSRGVPSVVIGQVAPLKATPNTRLHLHGVIHGQLGLPQTP